MGITYASPTVVRTSVRETLLGWLSSFAVGLATTSLALVFDATRRNTCGLVTSDAGNERSSAHQHRSREPGPRYSGVAVEVVPW